MTIPVLIAARNEADFIGRALSSLPQEAEPIVIPNGCTDNTADIARRFGAIVLDAEEEGKMGALQTGIGYLGRRALEPFVTLDADSHPLFPKHWLAGMLAARQKLPTERPALVVGAILFQEAPNPLIRNLWYTLKQVRTRAQHDRGEFRGVNTLVDPRNQQTLDSILSLGKLWPGEDEAIKDVIVANQGSTLKSMDAKTTVITDGSRLMSVVERLRVGGQSASQRVAAAYLHDAPPNAVQYAHLDRVRSNTQTILPTTT